MTQTTIQEQPAARPSIGSVCPSCGFGRPRSFYAVEDLPVHSCLMLETRAEAEAYPRRPLRLVVCEACGFIWNTAFESDSQEFSTRYQDQQGFSPRFRAYQTQCVHELVDRFDLRGRNVIEIGCGKGDFLIELCAAGGNYGIGIDPRCSTHAGVPGVSARFVPEFFGRKHAELPCDFLCCRHTLEHVPGPQAFVQIIRQVLEGRRDVIVFFEVPDTARILVERAFWDLYYEHCSYFTTGSLARLFRSNCFEILEIRKTFGDQYLTLLAQPTDAPTLAMGNEDDLGHILSEVDAFAVSVRQKVETWRARIAGWRAGGKRVAIWAAGSKCVAFMSVLGCADAVEAVVDINPALHGRFLAGSGKQVLPPEALEMLRPEVVVIMNPVYQSEIRAQLTEMGLEPEVLPL